MKTRTLAKFAKKRRRREIQAHTHTDLRDENRREKKERETGITVIRTVSSAYVE